MADLDGACGPTASTKGGRVNAAVFALVMSALGGARPRWLLVDRGTPEQKGYPQTSHGRPSSELSSGSGSGGSPSPFSLGSRSTGSHRAVPPPACALDSRYLARESAKFIARGRE